MENFYLKDLMFAIDGKLIIRCPNFLIKGISIDSRTIKKDEVYFAIKGSHYDGHNFINEAIEKGAVAIVYSTSYVNFVRNRVGFFSIIKTDNTLVALGKLAKAYRAKFQNMKIVAITGSNGKTTTKEILASIFSKRAKTLSSKGNFNNCIGLPLSIFNLTSDTKYAVFEIGTSLRGEIKILSNILNPDAGIITNIGFSHLDSFCSLDGVFKEKRSLFDNVKENGLIIINNDDRFLKTIRNINGREIITFALSSDANICTKSIELYADKTNFELVCRKNTIKISMPKNGRFNVANAIAAASCAIGFGFSLSEIKEGIEKFIPPKMRMETVITSSGVVLINDAYNANPSSVKEAIMAVLQSYQRKKINLVLGDMLELGDKSANLHFDVGEFINNSRNINSVNLFGHMSFNTKIAIRNKNVFYAAERKTLLKNIKQISTDANSVFFFKASRGMKLEEIYTEFYGILEKR
jgi:UDP-N-acetylmuramoyl-tripeptide--D-alanyl-D-alanine ligase